MDFTEFWNKPDDQLTHEQKLLRGILRLYSEMVGVSPGELFEGGKG